MADSITGLEATGIDHIVLKVRDVDASAEFYINYIGAIPEMEAEWRSGEREFLSLRIGDGLIDLIPSSEPGAIGTRGVAHICLVVDGADPEETREVFAGEGVLVESAVSRKRLGAKGRGASLYVTDPDGYRIELKWYDD